MIVTRRWKSIGDGSRRVTYPDAIPPDLGAPVSPPAMMRVDVLKDERSVGRMVLVRDWRNMFAVVVE